jgi:type VI protein secretion system component Hcp
VLISSYMIGGTEADDRPADTFSLNFAKFSFDYFAQKSDGSLDAGTHAGWDLKQNVKI